MKSMYSAVCHGAVAMVHTYNGTVYHGAVAMDVVKDNNKQQTVLVNKFAPTWIMTQAFLFALSIFARLYHVYIYFLYFITICSLGSLAVFLLNSHHVTQAFVDYFRIPVLLKLLKI